MTVTEYTLSEWSEKTGVPASQHETGAMYIHASHVMYLSTLSKWELYHLRDYIVSSNVAGVIWLTPCYTNDEQIFFDRRFERDLKLYGRY